jgi:uracil-DNA glycosylase family 4
MIEQFKLSPTSENAQMVEDKIVWGEGPFSARVIILGMCPGEQEMIDGRPFVGGSGRVFDRACGRIGLARGACYVTNLVKHFVPPGKPLPQALINQDRPLLEKELDTLTNAEVILTLGSEAFNALTGKVLKTRHHRANAEKTPNYWLRGCPYRWERNGKHYWILPAVHPSFVMRTGFAEGPLFENDLERARRFNEGFRPPTESFNYNASDQEVIEYARECEHIDFGLDIETPEAAIDDDDLDPMYKTPIELIGLSHTLGESVGVRPDQFHLLGHLLNTPRQDRPPCWTHNGGNFDFYHIRKTLGFTLAGIRPADAMLGMHLLWPHLTNKDAATCFSIFCDIPYYKNTRKLDPGFYNTIGNCRDTYGALWAGQSQLRAMRKFPRMEELFWRMMNICELINEMRVLGTNTDVPAANKVYLTLMKTLQAYEAWWSKNIPYYSWSSPKQLIEMFRKMGMPIFKRKRVKKDEDGNKQTKMTETMDDEALEAYVKRGSKTAALIQTMRGLKHAGDLVSVAREDGRIHPRLKLHGQVGGRIQAVDGNVQTIPEELSGIHPRSIVVADRSGLGRILFPVHDSIVCSVGGVIICADYSQIELRLYAVQSRAHRMLERLASGDYIYGFFYEELFKRPFFIEGLQRTKKNIRPTVAPWEILVVKSWPLGFIYGRGVPDPTGLPISGIDCKRLHDQFHRDNPEFRIFHTKLEFDANRNGYLISPFGRIRRFPNPKGQRNELLAFPGQSVAVDILIKNALEPLPALLRKFDNVEDVPNACKIIQETMEAPVPELEGWSFPIEIKVGPSWGELTSLEKWNESRRPNPQSGRTA